MVRCLILFALAACASQEIGASTSLKPGFFGGAGADVSVTRGVSIGVEVGVAHAATDLKFWETYDGEEERSTLQLKATWLYSDLHLIVRLGRKV